MAWISGQLARRPTICFSQKEKIVSETNDDKANLPYLRRLPLAANRLTLAHPSGK
jgi:hypothetical protein